MENLVVQSLTLWERSLSVLCGFEGFPPNSDDQGYSNHLVKNRKQSTSLKKNVHNLKLQRPGAALEGGLLRCSYQTLGGPYGVLFGYGIGSLYGLAAGTVPLIRQKLKLIDVVCKLIDGKKQPLSPWCKKTASSHRCLLHKVRHREITCAFRCNFLRRSQHQKQLCKSKKTSTSLGVRKWRRLNVRPNAKAKLEGIQGKCQKQNLAGAESLTSKRLIEFKCDWGHH